MILRVWGRERKLQEMQYSRAETLFFVSHPSRAVIFFAQHQCNHLIWSDLKCLLLGIVYMYDLGRPVIPSEKNGLMKLICYVYLKKDGKMSWCHCQKKDFEKCLDNRQFTHVLMICFFRGKNKIIFWSHERMLSFCYCRKNFSKSFFWQWHHDISRSFIK